MAPVTDSFEDAPCHVQRVSSMAELITVTLLWSLSCIFTSGWLKQVPCLSLSTSLQVRPLLCPPSVHSPFLCLAVLPSSLKIELQLLLGEKSSLMPLPEAAYPQFLSSPQPFLSVGTLSALFPGAAFKCLLLGEVCFFPTLKSYASKFTCYYGYLLSKIVIKDAISFSQKVIITVLFTHIEIHIQEHFYIYYLVPTTQWLTSIQVLK